MTTITGGIIVAVFPSRKILLHALDYLNESAPVHMRRAAIVAKAKNGETVILDDDISPNEGGIAGGTLGAAMLMLGVAQLGALTLPGVGPVIALGAGALIGGVLGHFTGRIAADLLDFGFQNEHVEALAQQLQAGHPALLMELDNPTEALRILRTVLKGYSAELIAPLHRSSTGELIPPDELQ